MFHVFSIQILLVTFYSFFPMETHMQLFHLSKASRDNFYLYWLDKRQGLWCTICHEVGWHDPVRTYKNLQRMKFSHDLRKTKILCHDFAFFTIIDPGNLLEMVHFRKSEAENIRSNCLVDSDV